MADSKALRFLAAALLSSGVLLLSCPSSAADSAEALKSGELDASYRPAAAAPAILDAGEVDTVEYQKTSLGSGLNVYFVNVFQGDAIYLELPNGKTVLIDAGPAPAPDSQYTTPIVSTFLKKQGVSKIDYMIMTHPHADHYGGMQWVFENLQVENFYDTRVDNSDAVVDNFVREAAKKEPGCVVHYPAEGDALTWDPSVKIKVLNACPNRGRSADHKDKGAYLNNCSIVLKVSYQGATALFMGDAQEEVEVRLVKDYGKGLKADVLKVGHHGSAFSSTADFLKKVKPRKAYIEVGKYNDYGHPTQAALERLKAVGAEIHRTDKEGTLNYVMRPAKQIPLDGFQKLTYGPLFSAE